MYYVIVICFIKCNIDYIYIYVTIYVRYMLLLATFTFK